MDKHKLHQFITKAVAAVPDVKQHLSAEAVQFLEAEVPPRLYNRRTVKASGDLSSVNGTYHDAITSALIDYFEGGPVATSRNQIKNAMITAFGDAFDMGYTDGGGELPIPDDALGWIEARLNQEAGFIDMLFQDAKNLRKDAEFDYFVWASERADGYTNTLQAIYNAGALWAKGNLKLTWNLGNTEKHCATCAKLDGSTHRASWYISRNYIPRQPGAGMDCGGYHCDCYLTDPKGETVTL